MVTTRLVGWRWAVHDKGKKIGQATATWQARAGLQRQEARARPERRSWLGRA
jgi:hypothetical protein